MVRNRAKWYSRRVIRKAMPALIFLLMVFLSLLFLVRYTQALFLVVILWVVVPVLAVKFWRWVRGLLADSGK